MTDAEIKAVLAEKVMGWTPPDGSLGTDRWSSRYRYNARERYFYKPDDLDARITDDEYIRAFCWRKGEREILVEFFDWDPLESIADAWLLVEALCDKGFTFMLLTHGSGHHTALFCHDTEKTCPANDASPKRAICLAALSCVEEGNDTP